VKKILIACCLALVLAGCKGNGTPDPSPPGAITEIDNDKSFSVSKNGNVTIDLNADNDPNHFWSVSVMSGDFEVSSDIAVVGKERFVVLCKSSGVLEFSYVDFTSQGAKTLRKFKITLVVQ